MEVYPATTNQKQLRVNPEDDFQEQLIYGITLKVLNGSQVQEVVICTYPEERRFLMVTNKLTLQISIMDWQNLKLVPSNLRIEAATNLLRRNLYFIIEDKQSLVVLFDNETQRNRILQHLANGQKILLSQHLTTRLESEAMRLFYYYNTNNDGYLQKSELQRLLNKLGIPMNNQTLRILKILSKQYNSGTGNLELDQKEFQTLLRIILSKMELVPIFKKFCPQFKLESLGQTRGDSFVVLQPIMPTSLFRRFLGAEQQLSAFQIQQTVAHHIEITQGWISFSAFCRYIYSDANSVIDSNKKKLTHSMNEPLTCYYIYSSHNTYLVGNQLTSESKAFRYVFDFYKGIKCVELDIHDGSDGPIIKHGYTATTSVPFEEVIHYIAEFSNLHPGHLPLFLSFENHCGTENQKVMARILEEKLGDKIFRLPPACDNFNQMMPSPEQLRNRIVIQGTGDLKTIRPHTTYIQKPQFVPTGRLRPSLSNNIITMSKRKIKIQDQPEVFLYRKKCFIKEWVASRKTQKRGFTQVMQQAILSLKPKLQVQQRSLAEYFSVVVGKYDSQRTCWEMANMSESTARAYMHEWSAFQEMTEFSKRSLIRIYPLGTRFDSSNYDPITYMEAGAQLVSLNTQGFDPYTYLLAGMFMENGGAEGGYLLKPKYIRSNKVVKPMEIWTLSIKLVSFQHLTIDEPYLAVSVFCGSAKSALEDARLKGVDVAVMMQLFCTPVDAQKNPHAKLQEVTEIVNTQTFAGNFKQSLTVTYKIEDLYFAHVYFAVPKCGQVSIPVRMLRNGLRVIPLMNSQKQFIEHCYLLAEISLVQDVMQDAVQDVAADAQHSG